LFVSVEAPFSKVFEGEASGCAAPAGGAASDGTVLAEGMAG
jgi:hypothetical protein